MKAVPVRVVDQSPNPAHASAVWVLPVVGDWARENGPSREGFLALRLKAGLDQGRATLDSGCSRGGPMPSTQHRV